MAPAANDFIIPPSCLEQEEAHFINHLGSFCNVVANFIHHCIQDTTLNAFVVCQKHHMCVTSILNTMATFYQYRLRNIGICRMLRDKLFLLETVEADSSLLHAYEQCHVSKISIIQLFQIDRSIDNLIKNYQVFQNGKCEDILSMSDDKKVDQMFNNNNGLAQLFKCTFLFISCLHFFVNHFT